MQKVKGVKRHLVLLVSAAVLSAEELPLSQQKQELLKLKRDQVREETGTGTTSWVSPLQLSLSYDRSENALGDESETKSAAVSWSQDLFRSGGIFYTIDQARASGRANLLSVDREEASYLKQLYTLKAQVERDTLKRRQSELTLKNRDIDLLIIKAKYKAGTADISELNRATIDRDSARTDVISVKNTLRSETYELKKLLGSVPADEVALPEFPVVSREAYLKEHLELLQYDAQRSADEAAWKVTRAAYLPKLTFNAAYGYSDYDLAQSDYDGDHYSYGAVLSMPLDLNGRGTVEASRLQSLQTVTAERDRKMELAQEYDMRTSTIGDYEEKIGVAEEMISMYDELYEFTKNQVRAGYKSSYDLESLGNSVQIQKLEKTIQEYNIRVERIALYFDTQLYKEQ
jgi:outer membrane protein